MSLRAPGKRSLMATRSSSFRWRASSTTPIPPTPRMPSTRYLPARTSPTCTPSCLGPSVESGAAHAQREESPISVVLLRVALNRRGGSFDHPRRQVRKGPRSGQRLSHPAGWRAASHGVADVLYECSSGSLLEQLFHEDSKDHHGEDNRRGRPMSRAHRIRHLRQHRTHEIRVLALDARVYRMNMRGPIVESPAFLR